MTKTLLIADDDHNVLAGLEFLLLEEGYRVIKANSPKEVVNIINRLTIDCLITDMNFQQDTTSGNEGLTLIKTLNQSEPNLPIIVMTGWATIDIAVEALKSGANDFVQKPWNDERLLSLIETQIKLASTEKKANRLQQQNQLLNNKNHPDNFSEIIANSVAMKELITTLKELALSDMNILLTGDNGTGKSMLARFVHQVSLRNKQPFVSVNMGAISENLFESEMFGHNKGAFTDAKENRIGRFEMAEQSTLFLDELANIPLSQQAKLLRVLEEKKFERVGSNKVIDADVRIISATNCNLAEAITQSLFRQDLYYRLNTIELRVPSLAERVDDILPLANHFLIRFSHKYHKATPKLSDCAIQQLVTYSWPGNIRELSHLMERVLFSCRDGLIKAEHLNLRSAPITNLNPQLTNTSADDGESSLDEIEKSTLISRLKLFSGNVTETARSLGLSRSGYYRRVQKYDLE